MMEHQTESRRKIINFWVVTRIWLSIWAALCSAKIPRAPLEEKMALWPPAQPYGQWISRIFLSPWDRWDVEHFLKISSRGYRADDGTLAFHPLYPWLGKVVGAIFGGDPLLGLFIVSNIAAILFLICLLKLARLDLSEKESYRASFYFVLLPTGFILFAPYTESIFLLFSVLSLLKARQGRWLMAGLAGGLAALTRQQGIFLLLPLAWEFFEQSQRDWRKMFANWRGVAGLALVPAGLLYWLIYRALTLGDVDFSWRRPGTFIYGLLISRSATEIVQDQKFIMPWKAFRLALTTSHSANTIDLLTGGVFLLLLILGGRKLWRIRPSYFLYSLATVAVSFSLSTGVPQSYMGLPRHCLLAFPLVFPLAIWGKNRVVNGIVVLLGLICLFALTLFYVLKILWLP